MQEKKSMHIVLFFPLGFAPIKAGPQPSIHSAFYTILEKTLPHDAIYMLRLGLLVIMWLGGKTHIFPSAAREQVETFQQLPAALNIFRDH